MKNICTLILFLFVQGIIAQESSPVFNQTHFDSLLYIQPTEAYQNVKKLIAEKKLTRNEIVEALNLLGNAAWVNGELLLSAEHYLECLRLMDSLGQSKEAKLSVLLNLGNVFNDLGALDMAKNVYRQGLNTPYYSFSMVNMATVFIREEQYDSASYLLKVAHRRFEEEKDTVLKHYYQVGLIAYNLGSIAIKTENPDSAFHYINTAIDVFQKQVNKKMLWTTQLLLAEYWAQKVQLEKAIALALGLLDSASSSGFGELKRDLHNFLYRTYKDKGQNRWALEQLEMEKIANTLLQGGKDNDLSSLIETYFEQKQRNEKLESFNKQLRLKADLQSEKTTNNLLLSLIIGIFMIAVNLIYSQNQKMKRRKLELMVSVNKREKLRRSLDESKSVSEQRQYQLHLQEKQLLTYSMKAIELSEFFELVLSKLKISRDSEINLELSKLIAQFQKQSKPWENFKAYFEGIHESFFSSLSSSHNLTSNDLKLSALSVLGFSSKQMANIMGIKPSSVDISRHRLRKKLELEPEQSLTDYLRSFLN